MPGERERLAAGNWRATWSSTTIAIVGSASASQRRICGSDRFIDAMVLWGDTTTVKGKLRTHFAAGATHVCIQPVHEEGDFTARDRILTALADT